MGPRSRLSLAGINLMVFLALVLLAEGGARLLAGPEARPLFDDGALRTRGRPFVAPHPRRGFALIPGYSGPLYHIDGQGFRAAPPAPAGAPLLVALGESTTFGWDVPDDGTYPAQLQELAAARGPALEVVNAGVPSYSSTQVLLYLEEILERRRPAGLLVSILWNDIWYSTALNWYPRLLIHQQPPVWLARALRHSALLRVILLKSRPDQAAVVDRFNPEALAQYASNLRAMLEVARARGVPLILVEPPFCPDLLPPEGLNEFHVRYTRDFFLETARQYRRTMKSLAAQYGAPVLDHRLSLENGGGPRELFLDLLHPSAAGNRLMAEDLLEGLMEIRGILPFDAEIE